MPAQVNMIHSVKVTNPAGESLTMVLTDPLKSGLAIFRIEGLGPANANVNMTELATGDGGFFNSSRVTPRNIVISVKPMGRPYVEDDRLIAYRYFPTKKKVKLEIRTRNRLVEAEGWVESNEPDIFSQQQTIQISIICPDPFFYSTGETITVFSGVRSMFEFPFSNESLTEDLIEFGEIRLDTRADIFYKGDADTGVEIVTHALGPLNDISIYNITTGESMTINGSRIASITGERLDLGDDIHIDTTRGRRGVRLFRRGEWTNVISALEPKPDWFQIVPGPNVFAFDAGEESNALLMDFRYRVAYGGI